MEKMKTWKKIVLAAVAVVVVGGTGFIVPTWWGKPWSIEHFYLRAVVQAALRSPMMLTQAGIPLKADELDDRSLEALREETEWLRKQIEVFGRYDREKVEDRVSYDVMDWFLRGMERESYYTLHSYPLNQMYGEQSGVPEFLLRTHPLNGEKDARNYVRRLGAVGTYFDGILERMRHQEELGILPPRFVVQKVLHEMREFIAPPPEEHVLYTHLAERLAGMEGLDDARRAKLLDEARAEIENTVYPTYRRLIEYYEGLEPKTTEDDGVWKLPEGAEFYEHRVRIITSTDMTPDEVHALGLREVERIQGEIRAILRELGYPTRDLGRVIRDLHREERFAWPEGPEGQRAVLARYQELIDEVSGRLDTLFHTLPRTGVEVVRTPAFREATAPRAQYTAPSLDGSRPGQFLVNLRDVNEHARFTMRTLAYHEAVPGHHLQMALAMENRSIPLFRSFVPAIAFTEGWGLYAEQLADEAGFLTDPYDRLGYLNMDLLRAARLVVDTGIHWKRWTRQQAIDYMLENTGLMEADIVAEVERYIVAPGQATGYKVGQLKLVELRERARERLGDRFDIRDYHRVVLGGGPMPLTVLEKVVDEWIADTLAGEGAEAR